MGNVGKKRKTIRLFDVFNYMLMALLAFVTIFPFYYVVIVSLANFNDISKQAIYLFPTSINLNAYSVIMKGNNIINAFFISIFVTVAGTIFNMFLTVSAAYGLSKKAMPGRNVLLTIVVFTMFFSGGLIPYYLTVKSLGLVNRLLVMIIPLGLNTFNLIIMKNFFTTIPQGLEESAKIDGANDLYVLWKIVLPTSAPILATITLFYAVERWNEWWHAMLFISDRDKFPLQMVLREMLRNFSQTIGNAIGASIRASKETIYPRSVQMAIVVVTTVPILLVYPFLQKHFTKGIFLGSIKE